MSLSGPFEYTSDSVTFGLDDIKVENDGEKLFGLDGIGLTVKVTAGAQIEKVPEFKNIMTLGSDELKDLGKEITRNANDFMDDIEDFGDDVEDFFKDYVKSSRSLIN